jgi:hypothetical protein
LKHYSADAPLYGENAAEILENNCKKTTVFGGDELMQIGLVTTDSAAGELRKGLNSSCDFDSRLYLLRA